MGDVIGLGGFCFSILGASVVAWGIWRAWIRPQEIEGDQSPQEHQPAPSHWSIRGEFRRLFLVEGVSDYVTGATARVPVMSPVQSQTEPDDQTDRQTDLVSEADRWLDRLEVDRTKTAVIELLVYSGWDVGQIRGVVKGDNGTIGTEIEAARNRLGIVAEPRQLRVRDAEGERMIPMET